MSPAPYPDDEVVAVEEALTAAMERFGLRGGELVGDGLESCVFRAEGPGLGEVVVRVPRYRLYRLPQREPFTALTNLKQEYVICAHLHRAGLPVAEPLLLVRDLPVPVLISRYVPTQRLGAAPDQIGFLLARLHALGVPPINPLDHNGEDLVGAMSDRLWRRWRRLHELHDRLDAPPSLDRIRGWLRQAGQEPLRLLHLDVRACNILSVDGRIAALVDWSCAMLGHPAAELARIDEYAQLPENELDAVAIRRSYAGTAGVPTVSPVTEALLRLDAVTMLGCLFTEYVPDRERAEWALSRVDDLAAMVGGYHGEE